MNSIEQLLQESAQAGDSELVDICNRALTGESRCIEYCHALIEDNAAEREFQEPYDA